MTDTMKTRRPRAACAPGNGIDPEMFYPVDERPNSPGVAAARAVCARCPVRDGCLEWALSHDIFEGVWGGLTGDERRALVATPWDVLLARHALTAPERHERAAPVPGGRKRYATCPVCSRRHEQRLSGGMVRHQRTIPGQGWAECEGTGVQPAPDVEASA